MFKWLESLAFEKGLKNTNFFRNVIRKIAYSRANGDPEKVHELALIALNEYKEVIEKNSKYFNFPDLYVNIAGHNVMPFGTAAGLDKNGDALYPLSKLFGYQKPGTVIVPERPGNNRIRVAIDEKLDEIYNAQGFPSRGLDYFLRRLYRYYELNGKSPLIINVCGIPPSPENLDHAYKDLENLLERLNPYADGFEWNPYSPNTKALVALRTPEEFKKSAKLMKDIVGNKLKIIKMGPYENNEERTNWLKLVEAFLDGGGDGLTAINTYKVSKEKIPSENWGYESAGRSGTFLQNYRQKALRDARKEFPNKFIFAAGGINSGEQAWEALQYADALEGYTAYTFKGFGLIIEMAHYISKKLKEKGYKNLKGFMQNRKFD